MVLPATICFFRFFVAVVAVLLLVESSSPTPCYSAFAFSSSSAFSCPGNGGARLHRRQNFARVVALSSSSSGKGFGSAPPEPPKKKKEVAVETPVTDVARQQQQKEPETFNAGRRALAEMRKQRAEEKDEELRRIREMKVTDQQVQEAPAAIPEKVAMRMGKRMLPFVGVPLFLSLTSFVGFWYLATYKDMEFQPALVAGVSSVLLIVGLLGITYSVMSASWDEDREGDLLGSGEFQKNVQNVQEGLGRSRENALLREKMAKIDDSEVNMALDDLQRREAAELKKQQSLQDKIKDELD